jgi:hypothetical protein
MSFESGDKMNCDRSNPTSPAIQSLSIDNFGPWPLTEPNIFRYSTQVINLTRGGFTARLNLHGSGSGAQGY